MQNASRRCRSWRSQLWRGVRIVLLVYLGLLVLLAVLQRRLIFLSTRSEEAPLVEKAARTGLVPWRDADGAIIGWKSAEDRSDAPYRMLVFHGNAGYAAHRGHFIPGLGPDWDVRLFEYPGYGARPGKPSEKTIIEAAEAALAQLQAEDERPIYVTGESLGSGAASHLAGAHPEVVRGVLLVTPFVSLPDVAAFHYPFLPVRWLMVDRFDNAAALGKFGGRVAALLAKEDEVVPYAQGAKLMNGYAGKKRVWVQEEGGHNDIDFYPSAAWWREATDFLTAP